MCYEVEVTFENSVNVTTTSRFYDSEDGEVKVLRDLARDFFKGSQKFTHKEFFKSKNNFDREGLRARPSARQKKSFYKLSLTTMPIKTRLYI